MASPLRFYFAPLHLDDKTYSFVTYSIPGSTRHGGACGAKVGCAVGAARVRGALSAKPDTRLRSSHRFSRRPLPFSLRLYAPVKRHSSPHRWTENSSYHEHIHFHSVLDRLRNRPGPGTADSPRGPSQDHHRSLERILLPGFLRIRC